MLTEIYLAWIFQIASTLTIATGVHFVLVGGALANNIVWATSGAVTAGAGSHFEGNILSFTGVTLVTGSTGNGRILAQTAAVLQMATIVSPA